MKRVYIFLFTVFVFSNILFAQTNYYTQSKRFIECEYSYQCDVNAMMVDLYNSNNTLNNVAQIITATGKAYSTNESLSKKFFIEDDWTYKKCLSILNNAFTDVEKKLLDDRKLGVLLYINSQTGKVMEVKFDFFSQSGFAKIPVSTYRSIELKLKSEVWFTPSDEGKKMNYLVRWWRQPIK